MKTKGWFLFWGLIFLVACNSAPTATLPFVKSPAPQKLSASATLLPVTRTPTILPSDTVRPTHSAVPSSTLTPARPTQTPSIRQSCSVDQPGLLPTFKIPEREYSAWPNLHLEQPVLDFLNAGGARQALIDYVKAPLELSDRRLFQKDLNGDDVPELVMGEDSLHIYTCINGRYYTAADIRGPSSAPPLPIVVQDMNLDGQLEIVLQLYDSFAVDVFALYQIIEWDGQTFQSLIPSIDETDYHAYIQTDQHDGWIEIGGSSEQWNEPPRKEWEVLDTDHNGTQELVLTGGIFVEGRHATGPQRLTKTTLMWDGKNFVVHSQEYSPAQFRFQVVQDADYAMLNGEYTKALGLYQQVISNDALDWWSEARLGDVMAQYEASYTQGMATPTPPPYDPIEREQLTAYAYYRIMLLKKIQNKPAEAQKAYDTLQTKFPAGKPGSAYAELAKAFLDNFRESKSIEIACSMAIGYADANKNAILYYIGDGSHFPSQSFIYKPKDICPFK